MKLFLQIAVCAGMILAGAVSGAPAYESHGLENGLEVFLEESHAVPLVTIRITFRAGAIVETPDLNGLCHLYEHMLFKGNEVYRTQESCMAAMKRMGVGNWNGGTSTEYVTYYFTIPSDRVEEGLAFWAYAVKAPLLDEAELEKEKEVVHNEIAGKQAQPEYIRYKTELKALYPDTWFRRDTSGELSVIDSATVEKMRFIRDSFYVPNNAALFLAGDFQPGPVLKLIREYYGDWLPGRGFPALAPHRALEKNLWVVVNNSPTRGQASVDFVFRGPDAGLDIHSTYGADVWGQMVSSPSGRFKNRMFEAVPELHGGTRYIRAGYFTQRDGGTTRFSFTVRIAEGDNLREIILRLRSALEKEIAAMTRAGYFSDEELSTAKNELANHDILSREVPANAMSTLSFWWASTSAGYYREYLQTVRAVGLKDVRDYLEKYIAGARYMTSVWLSPEDDARQEISSWDLSGLERRLP